MEIRASLQELLGPAMKATTELAAAPLSRPGGKIPLIVNQVIPPSRAPGLECSPLKNPSSPESWVRGASKPLRYRLP
jgi:hypothetical protein